MKTSMSAFACALLLAGNCSIAQALTHAEWTALWHPNHPTTTGGGVGTTGGGNFGTTGGPTDGGHPHPKGGGGGTTGGTTGGVTLTITPRIWDPGDTNTATYNVVNVCGHLCVALTKNAASSTNSAANGEINGAKGMTVTVVNYDFKGDGKVGWDILTSDNVDHIWVPGQNSSTDTNIGDGWTRRVVLPSQFSPPITPSETIAAQNAPDFGYNAPDHAGPVSAVELINNQGTTGGGSGTTYLTNVQINGNTAHPLLH